MRELTNSYLNRAGEETRLVVETLLQVVPGTEIVAVVTDFDGTVPGFDLEPMVGPESMEAYERIGERVRSQLKGESAVGAFSCVVSGVEWGVLVDPIKVQEGDVVGALIVARHGRTWSTRERSLTRAFGSLLSHVATLATREGLLLHQGRLDELVAQVAAKLMPPSATNRQEVLDWVCRVLAEFLNADVAFIRRNDLVRGLSILEAEWPPRDDVPDPDPLGEISFDADPLFMAMRDLRAPYLTATEDVTDDYRDRIMEGTGLAPAAGAAVPLLLGDSTWGILGFLHFNLHNWSTPEINALQAVASMLVQLQGRIDAEERTRFNANHDELTGLPNRRALIQEPVS